MSLQRTSLGPEERHRLKLEAAGERPYVDRISLSLAFLLLYLRQNRGDEFAVLDQLDFLEGRARASGTKPDTGFKGFKHPLLKRFRHKHYSSARHISFNIAVRWGLNRSGNQALDRMIADVVREYGHDPEAWQRVLCHRLVMEGLEDRAGRMTGEWIIYAIHEGENYYLTLATHEEGRKPERLFGKLRRECEAEWPFLFDDVGA